MPRTHKDRTRVKPAERRPANDSHFTWQEGDVQFVFPQQPQTVISDELHTILWSLEHVTNKASYDEVLPAIAGYLTDHPGDPLVAEAIRRVELRLEHST